MRRHLQADDTITVTLTRRDLSKVTRALTSEKWHFRGLASEESDPNMAESNRDTAESYRLLVEKIREQMREQLNS